VPAHEKKRDLLGLKRSQKDDALDQQEGADVKAPRNVVTTVIL